VKQYPDSSAIPNYTSLLRLDGRGYLVLGAGDGIGRQTCHALAQAGAQVICVDRDAGLAEKVAQEISGVAMVANVTSREDMQRTFHAAKSSFAERFAGVVDIVGIANITELTAMDDAAWDSQFDLVLRHAWLAIQFGGAALAERGGGSMVFVGSISGLVSVAKQAAYGAAKAALHHLVRCAAHELGNRGVRVNAVAPGFVRTPRLLSRLSEGFWDQVSEINPLGRVAVPADIASAILYLASDLSGYVTANVLTLDGGMHAIAALPEIRPPR
jgi:NAD(P)-dependent dehydrogenase (short-subunit alcohol dehydrogenase family)